MDEWARPADLRADVPIDLPTDLQVFATGSTMLVERSHDDTSAVGDALRRGGAAVRDLHARPGYRPGNQAAPIATTSGRRTGAADVVHTVLLDPRRAARIALDRLFDEPVEGLEIHVDHPDVHHRFLLWEGSLTGAHLAPVEVSLHLLASPSLVVTVLELIPQERLRWHRQAFVRSGVAVVETLAQRLTRLAA